MAKKIDRQEEENTPPPRLANQGDAGTEEVESVTQTDAAKVPNTRATSRRAASAPVSTTPKKERVTLILTAKAAKRLRDWCHVSHVELGAKVSELIMADVPSCSIRINEPGRASGDTGEDRQESTAA
jgi:hypothetical protein